jgi:hypothetical protein
LSLLGVSESAVAEFSFSTPSAPSSTYAFKLTRQVVLDTDLLEPLVNLFGPISTRQIEHLEKIRAKGRKHYILYTGILGWGMSAFLLTTFWIWYDKYGWQFPSLGDIFLSVLIGLPLWSVGGYIWATIMWNDLIENLLRRETGTKPLVA